ncbi:MAG TPA: hypothetical protein VHX52_11050 [Steroidobacteraceae bacterium]|nr:hypothetical protein [Steroidobacteraceae bacterium]
MSALELLPRLLQAVLRHLFAYGELLCQELVAAARRGRRRLWGAAVAVIAGLMALGLGCLWVIAATWDGPDRLIAVGALCVGFALIAIIGAVYAGRGAAARPFERLRAEWRADMDEIARLDPSLVGHAHASAAAGQHAGRD